ncbi:cation diffusion facilitator family transporter [Spirilliplanes yamanashiensis]|uniref:Cation efflux system protein n=1 Tax=Spirilliplanes yamanashiensis TaxID=42233 RepID=A0A8J3YDI6_9ACTN|nr:cation diffusion facilitator family transporter [Spirilliplanes yamanashiensis]MDP9818396.1 cobalt-zinc-cadmium efflux system protein [Spirilliplanes yamanashiensis]GIJ06618.1 cation efflux system protein [Spirilliplanes yamanashiensis]
MGAGHDHGARSAGEKHAGRLWAAFAVLAVFMVLEVVGGLISGSLALLSDAGHMFTDVLGIGMALAAIYAVKRAARGTGNPQRTFGAYRLEVLAALANAALLLGVAVWVCVEAVRRFTEPPEVLAGPMLAIAIAGLLANLVAFALLRAGSKESLNVRGAYLEVLGDILGSVGAIAAAVVIATTGWRYADPIIAVAMAVLIVPRTLALARSAVRILIQAAPEHVDVAAVQRTLQDVPGVAAVHDLHLWTLTSGMDVAQAHLALQPEADVADVLAAARTALHDGYDIDHATLQLEPAGAGGTCHPAGW